MTTVLWPHVLDAPTLPDCTVRVYDTDQPLPQDVADAEVFVVWARPGHLFAEDARLLRSVTLVQSLMAGTEQLEAAGFAPGSIISSGSGLHDRTVTEHTLALILALVRRLPRLQRAQEASTWDTGAAGHQPLHHDGPVTTLLDARVTIWGFGSIAATLAPVLSDLGARVTGIARSAGERHGYRVVSAEDAGSVLAETDVLVSILPGGPETADALGADVFAALPDHAYVVNVGRGSVLDEDALVAALENGTIAGAALDVMKTEPLPEDSPLWTAPNIVLTPHCAGGRPVEPEKLVADNIAAVLAGRQPRNVVKVNEG